MSREHLELRSWTTAPRLLSPLADGAEVTSPTEIREDPLTGRRAIVGLNLSGKRSVLYSRTDVELVERLAAETRDGCFFCPEKVESVTPKYPPDLVAAGRLRRNDCLLFPNLFPLTDIHAVATLGERHYRPLDAFNEELLFDGLSLGVELITSIENTDEGSLWWCICSNYLPPGGASIVHPHLQVLGSSVPLTTPRTEYDAAREYMEAHGRTFFDDLVETEIKRGERFVATDGPVTWLAAYAPRGNTELIGVCRDANRLADLTEEDLRGFAAGFTRALRLYHSLGYSSYNFAIYGGPPDAEGRAFRVYASIVSRQSLVPNYRCDDYFLQKMLGTEIVIDSPEQVASMARSQE